MRNLPSETDLELKHKSITVRFADDQMHLSLLRLKNKNKPHLREWFVERTRPTDTTRRSYGVFNKSRLVGEVSLRDFTSLTCEIAYWTDSDFWGLGLTTTAVKLVSDHALQSLNVLEVIAHVHIDNTASAKVLEKVGYKYLDTTLKPMYLTSESAPHLMYTYANI